MKKWSIEVKVSTHDEKDGTWYNSKLIKLPLHNDEITAEQIMHYLCEGIEELLDSGMECEARKEHLGEEVEDADDRMS